MPDSNITFDEKTQEKIVEQIYFFNKDMFHGKKPKRLNQIPPELLESNPDGVEYLKTQEGKQHLEEWNDKRKTSNEQRDAKTGDFFYYDFHDNIGDDNNTYCKDVAKILREKCGNVDKFYHLFSVRFGLKPQIKRDRKLMAALEKPTISDKDWLILTQRHLNDFGGIHHDSEKSSS